LTETDGLKETDKLTDRQKPNKANDRLTQKCKYIDRHADCDTHIHEVIKRGSKPHTGKQSDNQTANTNS
jgi:hypothetical protein